MILECFQSVSSMREMRNLCAQSSPRGNSVDSLPRDLIWHVCIYAYTHSCMHACMHVCMYLICLTLNPHRGEGAKNNIKLSACDPNQEFYISCFLFQQEIQIIYYIRYQMKYTIRYKFHYDIKYDIRCDGGIR